MSRHVTQYTSPQNNYGTMNISVSHTAVEHEDNKKHNNGLYGEYVATFNLFFLIVTA